MKITDDIDLLNSFITSLGLSREASERFINLGKIVYLEKGETFVMQDSVCRYLGAVLSGKFSFQHCDDEGNVRTVGFNSNGFITEYHSLLAKLPARYSITAITNAVLFRFSRQQMLDFYEFSMETQRFGRHIAEQLFFQRDNLLFAFRCNSVEARYKKLMEIVDDNLNTLSLKDMAYLIGVTPETISRVRRKMQNNN